MLITIGTNDHKVCLGGIKMNTKRQFMILVFMSAIVLTIFCQFGKLIAQIVKEQRTDRIWGTDKVNLKIDDSSRGQLFRDGNYAMFIHFGLYARLANKYKGKTYYGISEWIMNSRMANIPVKEYKQLANTFHPVNFDGEAIARLAKDAGMKYIIITSKHHIL